MENKVSEKYESCEARERSFNGTDTRWDRSEFRKLAEAGFHYNGSCNSVKCHCCSFELRHQPNIDPQEMHLKLWSFCPYLEQITNKETIRKYQENENNRQTYYLVHRFKLSDDKDDRDIKPDVNGKIGNMNERKKGSQEERAVVKRPRETGAVPKTTRTQNEQIYLENELSPKDLKERKLKYICTFCKTEDVEIVFQPCGHLIACADCASANEYCTKCGQKISEQIKTFLA